jgi:hypothetical protein
VTITTRVWRRLVYCWRGHEWMFTREARGLRLVCRRCLSSRLIVPAAISTRVGSGHG